jgi:hypothetical protein
MERTGVLIERLIEQYRNNTDADKLIITAQLLLAELQQQNRNAQQVPEQKISVFFPSFSYFNEAETEILAAEEKKQDNSKHEKAFQPIETEIPQTKRLQEFFDPLLEIPTLALKQQEINETIASNAESLNDKLKSVASHTEVGHTIKVSPVKDLRKAIGINDRYLFISELFRGDEIMYDRSIKTINGFNIYGEAEFWIKRELKLKLGWNDKNEAVHIFDQLIKRRFS